MSHFHWIFLSVLTGIFFGFQVILIKVLSVKADRFTVLAFLFSITGILLLPFGLANFSHFYGQRFFPAFLVSFILNIFAYLLLIRAIRISPVSIVMPFVGFTPVFLIFTGYLILGETVSAGQSIGILLIITGGFILQMPQMSGKHGWHKIFNVQEKGIGLMLLVAFIWSITASVEKIAVQSSSPSFYGAMIHLSLGVFFTGATVLKKPRTTVKKDILGWLVVLGVVGAALAISQLTAIKITMVTNVIAFKRAGVIVSTLAGFFFFKEKNYIKAALGTLLIIFGTALISFLG